MLQYENTSVSEGIDIDKTNVLKLIKNNDIDKKECMLCYY